MQNSEQMTITLGWADGTTEDVEGVEEFSRSWQGDEYVVSWMCTDGSEDWASGKQLAVVGGSL